MQNTAEHCRRVDHGEHRIEQKEAVAAIFAFDHGFAPQHHRIAFVRARAPPAMKRSSIEHPPTVDVFRQGKLDEDSVDGVVSV